MAWFGPFKQVCPVKVVFMHRQAVQLVLNKEGMVRLFRSFFHHLTGSSAGLSRCWKCIERTARPLPNAVREGPILWAE